MKILKLTPTGKLKEIEWQNLRHSFVDRGMVGGSDAGTLLGLNKYKSPINLFYQSVGISRLPNKMNGIMLHGKQLEDYVAKCWQYYDGTEEGWVENTLNNNKIKSYKKVRAIIENRKFPTLFANIDGKITKHPIHGRKAGVLEVKTISGYSADSYEAGIPPSYLVQLQHYLLVTEWSYGEIVYLKDGRELGCVTFEANRGIQDSILLAAEEFHNRVMAAKKEIAKTNDVNEQIQIASHYEPDADNSQAFNDFVSEKHKAREEEVTIQGTDECGQWALSYTKLNAGIKVLESEKQLFQNRLKQVMEKEGATTMMLPNGKITWRKSFSVKL
jgi:predicted phage-related endonuclease